MTFEWDEKKNKINTMKTMTLDEVKNYVPTEEELERVRNFKNTDFSDNPKLTPEELKEFRPWYEVHPNDVCIDTDIIRSLVKLGSDWQVRLNQYLRKGLAASLI